MSTATATTTRSRIDLQHRIALLALTIAVLLLTLTATPTYAFDNNAPNATLAGYGVSVGAYVACDATTGTMSVSATATTMQASGPLGPVLGQYDAGQWVRYNVLTREVGTADWLTTLTWSDWEWIVSVTSTQYVEYLDIPQALGTSNVYGTAGHNYEVMVQVDYWTGSENIVNVTPTFSQTLSLDPYNTWYLNPSYCHL